MLNMTVKVRLKIAISILVSEKNLIVAMPIGIVLVALMKLLRPFVLIRVGFLRSDRIGHFAINHEIFLCEEKVFKKNRKIKTLDFYYLGRIPVCNEQLSTMWRRVLRVYSPFLLRPISLILRSTPLLSEHVCGDSKFQDRDVNHVLDNSTSTLSFTDEEEVLGKITLREFGVPEGSKFVCLIVRDDLYTQNLYGTFGDYHNYRNCDIDNFVLAAEELANRGIYVLRMGSAVSKVFKVDNPKIIDYATNGMRSDFMDIYLAAKCLFCITTGLGFDSIPTIFRRPVVFVNHTPVGYLHTFLKTSIFLTKHHINSNDNQELNLREILNSYAVDAFSSDEYKNADIKLLENTSDEIRDVVLEMFERIQGSWTDSREDEFNQKRFRQLLEECPKAMIDQASGRQLHGRIVGRYGTKYLQDNSWFIN